ncbi:MAG TPA: response regulator transcription factor [Solirubrobacteraceae bacterium]|nr:response regulator transcription factor [Solirubrobacteraceae bacterium]
MSARVPASSPPDRAADGYSPPVRVLLAGPALVRAALRELLPEGSGVAVAAEAATGPKALALAREIRPDVVLMSVRLAHVDGLEASRLITTDPELSQVQVLILSYDGRDGNLYAALRAGASGFLTANTEPAELLRAVRVVVRGGMQLPPDVTRRLIDKFASQPVRQRSTPVQFEELTLREQEVVSLVARGLSNDEIAERLVVSPATAKTHVSRSMVKLRVRDRAKLVALAYQTGFAQPSLGLTEPRHSTTAR